MKKPSSEILLVEYVCPKCGQHLAWVLPSTEIICPLCGKWVTEKNRKKDNVVYLPANSDQLVLFY